VLRKCIPCQKVVGQPCQLPDPPPLPKDSVSDCIPFSIAGVDYAGPLYVKVKRQSKKMYICLFTSATTRVVHLELVQDLSTETFVLGSEGLSPAKACHTQSTQTVDRHFYLPNEPSWKKPV
jgi:hypothetical protein